MKQFLMDMHTHTTFSHDGRNSPAEMLDAAQKKGISFYGISDHFDYDYDLSLCDAEERQKLKNGGEEEYFHVSRHLQEDYEGVMNVAVGAEFGFSKEKSVQKRYVETYEKYRPDFVINSVHSANGVDFCRSVLTDKQRLYRTYLALIRESLDVPYPYDIVAHVGYIMRYAPFENVDISLSEFGKEIDDILLTIVKKDKILEVNTASKHLDTRVLPTKEILTRYYELGGRKVSYGSDAHFIARIGEKYEEVIDILKKIGFTYLTVPFRGEHIKIELSLVDNHINC